MRGTCYLATFTRRGRDAESSRCKDVGRRGGRRIDADVRAEPGCAAPPAAGDATANARPAAAARRSAAAQKPLRKSEVQATLTAAYAAFERKQLDEAMSGADRVLAGNPAGPGAAEAHYLRGRVFEERATQAANGRHHVRQGRRCSPRATRTTPP